MNASVGRAGWWRLDNGERVYLFTASGMREALTGHDFTRALDVVITAGAMQPPGADCKRSHPERIDGRRVRVYPIHADRLEPSA